MGRKEIKVCVLRTSGTSGDLETKLALEDLGAKAEVIHVNEMIKRRNLAEYDALVIPGGFSYGNYVRAGAIWAKQITAKLGEELEAFVNDKRPIIGICNGFQVLVEAGLLPGFDGISPQPEAALTTNIPFGYNCMWVHVKHENAGNCKITREVPKGRVLRMPVAHSEGRFMFEKGKEVEYLRRLYENDQLVFRYCDEGGEYADGRYPANPDGSFHDIAGICNPEGTVLGLMPHPERAFYWWQQPDWTRRKGIIQHGDGRLIFEGLIKYLRGG